MHTDKSWRRRYDGKHVSELQPDGSWKIIADDIPAQPASRFDPKAYEILRSFFEEARPNIWS